MEIDAKEGDDVAVPLDGHFVSPTNPTSSTDRSGHASGNGNGRTSGSNGASGSDISLTMDVAGPPDAQVVLFVHGTRVTRHMWHPQMRAFASDYRMVTIDLPAHGSLKHVPFRLHDAKERIVEALDGACGGRAIVVGQSMGGYLSMLVAAERPDAVAGLVLSNCSAEPRTVARHATGSVWSYLRMAMRQRVNGHVPGPEAWPTEDDAVESTVFEPATHGILFRGSSRALASALRMRFLPHLAAYPGPTLIINGEHDPVFRRSEREFLDACRDGRLVVVEGAGHLVNIEGAEAFNAALRAFVDGIGLGRPTTRAATEASDDGQAAPKVEPSDGPDPALAGV